MSTMLPRKQEALAQGEDERDEHHAIRAGCQLGVVISDSLVDHA